MQAIGTNLRRLRVRAGLTQDALAGMLHVTRQTVSSWEIGRTEPDLDTLLALAEALHCDATELIYGVKRNGYQQYQRRWIVCSMVCGVLVTLLVSLLVGILIGCWQGMWIAYFDIPAFLVTLSGELVFRGLTQVVLDGASIGPFSDTFRAIASSFIPDLFGGSGFHLTTMILAVLACAVYVYLQLHGRADKQRHGVPVRPITGFIIKCVVMCAVILYLSWQMASYNGYPTVLIIMLVLCLVYSFICSRTIFGRGLYAIGGNRKAAMLSGVKDRLYFFLAYANMGLMSAVAALVYAARLNAATPKAGVNFELDAIAACFVGGASVTGGAGTIGGALVGCFVIGILNNGMSMMGISADWQQTVKGLVILAAVAFDLVPKRKKK